MTQELVDSFNDETIKRGQVNMGDLHFGELSMEGDDKLTSITELQEKTKPTENQDPPASIRRHNLQSSPAVARRRDPRTSSVVGEGRDPHSKKKARTSDPSTESDSEEGSDDSSDASSEISEFSDIETRRHAHVSGNNRTVEDQEYIRKRFYIDEIEKFRTYGRAYTVPDVSVKDSIDHLEKIYNRLTIQRRSKTKMKMFHVILVIIAWIIEKVGEKWMGFSSIHDFHKHIRSEQDEFNEYYDEMTRPIQTVNLKTGDVEIVENPSIINQINMRPEYDFIVAFVLKVMTYTSINKIDSIVELMGRRKDESDDDEESDDDSEDDEEFMQRLRKKTEKTKADLAKLSKKTPPNKQK